jgi:hypothetical protein
MLGESISAFRGLLDGTADPERLARATLHAYAREALGRHAAFAPKTIDVDRAIDAHARAFMRFVDEYNASTAASPSTARHRRAAST